MSRLLSIDYRFATDRELRLALGLLTAMNVQLMAWHSLPLLYSSGVRYAREPGTEAWLTAPELFRRGQGDCEDLSCTRAAELRAREGERATPVPLRWERGWHIVVRRADGRLEDPSVRLGMPTSPKYFQVMERAQREAAI